MAQLGVRNVRNFWLEVRVDGQKPIAAGPKSGRDGLEATLYLREHGTISADRFELRGYVDEDGSLMVVIDLPKGAMVVDNPEAPGTQTVILRKER